MWLGCALVVWILVTGCAAVNKKETVVSARPDAEFHHALRLMQENDVPGAIDMLDRVIVANPDDSVALYNRGYCFQQTEAYLNAVADYTAALEIDPDMVQAACNRGSALFAHGQKDEARKQWESLARRHPEYAPTFYNLGLYYLEKKQFDRAVKEFSRAINRDPSMTAAFVNRANGYVALGRLEEAAQDYTRAIALKRTDAQIYFNRAVAWDEMADYDQAISDYSRAVAFDPDFAAAYYNRGILYMRLGGKRLGCADMSQACSLGLCDRYRQLQKLGDCPLDVDEHE
ncbi:hypothetical protein DPF_0722 [Desulfoplanes formicivorans]|uniref:Uncharacterized protein n=2 Tax=Desulfoplanes formicivorans TaxID=1592317 RepID=A0A194AG11_9BACT|nr:hypothetical protein DPF_0722 [Desulfoplanes formicivorans]